MSAPYCNERFGTYAANALSYVARHIGDYLPDEALLEGTELVVRIPDMTSMPTVELNEGHKTDLRSTGKMYGKKRLMISAEDHEMLRMWCRKSLGSSYAADSLFDKDAPEKGFDFEELVAECVSSWCCGGADEKAAAIAERLGGDRR